MFKSGNNFGLWAQKKSPQIPDMYVRLEIDTTYHEEKEKFSRHFLLAVSRPAPTPAFRPPAPPPVRSKPPPARWDDDESDEETFAAKYHQNLNLSEAFTLD